MFCATSESGATIGPASTLTISPGIKWMMPKLISETPNSTGTAKTMRPAAYLSIDYSICALLQPGLPKIDALHRRHVAITLQLVRPHLPAQRRGTGRDDVGHIGDALLHCPIKRGSFGFVIALPRLGEQFVQHGVGRLARIDLGVRVQ